MKKLICCMLTLSVCCFALTACDGGTNGSNPPEPDPPLTLDETLRQTDANYDRAVYLGEGDTYNLLKQYEYEKISSDGATFETDGEAFTIDDGVITAGTAEDVTSEALTVKFGADKTEKVVVHVANRQKYGARYTTIDAGMLYGKSVTFFGDSITHNWAKYPNGDTSLVNDTQSLGYNHIPRLNEFCHFEKIVNAAWSGGTVAYLPSSIERFVYKSFPGAVDNNIDNVKDSDLIFVWYGTNDLTEQVPVGNPTDVMTPDGVTDYNFYASLNYALNRISETNPNATVVIMNVMIRDHMTVGNAKIGDYNDALSNASTAHKTKYLNINKLFTMRQLKVMFKDGLHPNDDGYDAITDYILLTNKTIRR